jgi:pilus assembly protein CpaB
MRIFLVILAALIVAGGTGFYVLQGLQPPAPAQAEAPEAREVYAPVRELAAGTLIAPQHLSRMPITDGALTAQMIVADAGGEGVLVGSVARQVLPQGVPIARSAIVQPGDRGFLAAVLPKGKRAITIPISEVAALSGLVLPGDRVDLILTYSVDAEAAAIRASETVLTNIRVLALDQRLGPVQPSEEDKKSPVAETATLEVTPEQAEMLTLAQTLGSLSLVLNSVRDGGDDAVTPVASVGPRASFRSAAEAPRPRRRMTIDSDVTSTTKVQVVRGVRARASATPDAAPAPAPATE